MLLEVDRKSAIEFSFFLAIPTMLAATVYALYKTWGTRDSNGGLAIAVGFLCAFLAALAVACLAIGFIGRHGFAPFAIYRILLGTIFLWLLLK